MRWNINNEVVFMPEKNLIISLKDQKKFSKITTPASRCFTILLEAAPYTVRQEDLLLRCWVNEGLPASQNILYQSIFIIRRALKEISDSGTDIINTVPRKGFNISASIDVSPLGYECEEMIYSQSEEKITPKNMIFFNAGKNLLGAINNKKLYFFRMFMVITSTLLLTSRYQQDIKFLTEMVPFEIDSGYIFYVPEDYKEIPADYHHIKNVMVTSRMNYSDFPYAYIYFSRNSATDTVLLCSSEIKKNIQKCMTLFVRKGTA